MSKDKTITALEKHNAKLQAENERHRWIPVGEGLPETSEIVLSAHYDGNVRWVETRWYNFGDWSPNNDTLKHITHWKPIILPDQAKEGGQRKDSAETPQGGEPPVMKG